MKTKTRRLYECGICDCYHPQGFDGDCRDDANRITEISARDEIVWADEMQERKATGEE